MITEGVQNFLPYLPFCIGKGENTQSLNVWQKVDRQRQRTANVSLKIKSQNRELNCAEGSTEYLICCKTGALSWQLIIWDVPVMAAQGLLLQAQIFKPCSIPYLWTDRLWSAKPVTVFASLFSSFIKLLIRFYFRQVYRAMLYLGQFTEDYFLC